MLTNVLGKITRVCDRTKTTPRYYRTISGAARKNFQKNAKMIDSYQLGRKNTRIRLADACDPSRQEME
jgi:hypothetical protein